jgi:hypothetical protein
MTDVLRTALAFAHRGHAVFPVTWPVPSGENDGRLVCSCGRHARGPKPCGSPAKHPYGKLAPSGLLSATTESGIIKHWFGVAAPQANLGVVTDKLVVVDVDPRHGGDDSLRLVEREHGEMPPTWRVLTGGGGEHIIFARPNGAEIANVVAEQMTEPPLGRGIDIRSKGGYIVAPPSRHINGRPYAWSVDHHPQNVSLASPPDWLIEKLACRSNNIVALPKPANEWAKLVVGPITEYRDMAAAKIAGHLFRRWVDIDVVVSLMRGWNVMHCIPPLTDGELLRILNRIADREAARLERENRQ